VSSPIERALVDPENEPTYEPIVLADPDPAWPAVFAAEAARIRELVGEQRVLRLEHIGSTSVPGLPAKPRIDMLLVVPDPADEDAWLAPLLVAGYTLRVREPDWYEHRVVRGPGAAINLHVVPDGCPETDRWLGFRDRLRTHPADRDAYAAAKRELAGRRWKYVNDYADAKSGIIESIIARALGQVGQRPAPAPRAR
jgi:GrpB-like predicted nucleotidyltransferase (UPF0157 family)